MQKEAESLANHTKYYSNRKMAAKKLILVIGATGAQGKPVVSALLAPQDDGTPSPYSVRALTRDRTSEKAQEVASLGAELFQGWFSLVYAYESLSIYSLVGNFVDMNDIAAALEGCYGVFVNTDSWSVGEQKEIYTAIKIFEQAHRAPALRHFIWSGLDYGSKVSVI